MQSYWIIHLIICAVGYWVCIDSHWYFPSAVLIIMIAVKITICRSNKHFGWKQCRTHVHLSGAFSLVILEFLCSSAIPNKKFTSHICVETMGWPWLCPGDQCNHKDVFGAPPFVRPASLRNLQWAPVNWRGIHIFAKWQEIAGGCWPVSRPMSVRPNPWIMLQREIYVVTRNLP